MTKRLVADSVLNPFSERRTGQGTAVGASPGIRRSPGGATTKASSMRVGSARVHPNKRLKLAAPGLGRIPFVPQRTSCSCANLPAPAGWGAAA